MATTTMPTAHQAFAITARARVPGSIGIALKIAMAIMSARVATTSAGVRCSVSESGLFLAVAPLLMLVLWRFLILVLPLGSARCMSVCPHNLSWRRLREYLWPILRLLRTQ